jgi:hypothetical protein
MPIAFVLLDQHKEEQFRGRPTWSIDVARLRMPDMQRNA